MAWSLKRHKFVSICIKVSRLGGKIFYWTFLFKFRSPIRTGKNCGWMKAFGTFFSRSFCLSSSFCGDLPRTAKGLSFKLKNSTLRSPQLVWMQKKFFFWSILFEKILLGWNVVTIPKIFLIHIEITVSSKFFKQNLIKTRLWEHTSCLLCKIKEDCLIHFYIRTFNRKVNSFAK